LTNIVGSGIIRSVKRNYERVRRNEEMASTIEIKKGENGFYILWNGKEMRKEVRTAWGYEKTGNIWTFKT
jgi:hypothetical protein